MALDLSRIDALTREVLEAEARKRGIRSPEFRTRAELVRLILRSQYGERLSAPRDLLAQGAKTVAQARGLLGEVVSAALSALPEPLDALARLRSGWPLTPGRPPAAPATRAAPAPRPTPAAPAVQPEPEPEPEAIRAAPEHEPASIRAAPESEAIRAAPEAEPAPAPEPEPVRVAPALEPVRVAPEPAPEPIRVAPAPVPEPVRVAPEPAPSSAPPPRAAERPSAAPIGAWSTPPPPPPPRPAHEPATRTFVEEPIRTRSMARLLAAQGHRERALAIYEELLAQNSEDAGLRSEADALRRGEPVSEPRLSAPTPGSASALELPDAGDRLWCEGDPQHGLRLRWQLTEQGQERARAVLGHHGELAIRVVAIKPHSADVVRSEITEHGPVSASGEWIAPGLLATTRCFAAVGLRDGERFVAVVHARPHGA